MRLNDHNWQKLNLAKLWICVEFSADADVADIYEQYEQQIEKFKEVKIQPILQSRNWFITNKNRLMMKPWQSMIKQY